MDPPTSCGAFHIQIQLLTSPLAHLNCRFICEANKDAVVPFEQALFPLFTDILQQDVAGVFV